MGESPGGSADQSAELIRRRELRIVQTEPRQQGQPERERGAETDEFGCRQAAVGTEAAEHGKRQGAARGVSGSSRHGNPPPEPTAAHRPPRPTEAVELDVQQVRLRQP